MGNAPDNTAFQDIVTLVERESARMGHYYLGVEHLFIALTRIENGVTASALKELGLSARFVRHAIRAAAGSGDNRRYWPAFRPTPRYQMVLERAGQMAHQRRAASIEERDLLLAILHEGQSIPVRTLTHLGVDLERFIAVVSGLASSPHAVQPSVPVTGATLTPDELRVLGQMFRSYARVEVEREFPGFSGARVLLVRPIKTDGRADAALVVKLDEGHTIRYETSRYDSYVKSTLPPVTARISDPPVVLDEPNIGGLKYTLVGQEDIGRVQTLYGYVQKHGPATLKEMILSKIYGTFGRGWWKQRQAYNFNLWQEYEHVLPYALVVELDPTLEDADRVLVPSGSWSRDGSVHVGDLVRLERFTIYRIYPDQQQIALVGGAGPAASERAHKVIVHDVTQAAASLGDRAARLVGRVVQTRQGIMTERVRAIFPDVDPTAPLIVPLPGMGALPNPLAFYGRMLDMKIAGTLSTIHGDLHLGNILVDPDGNAWLIDFRWSRDGHTLFDWAVLEVSLLADVVAPLVETDVAPAAALVAALNEGQLPAAPDGALVQAFGALAAVRQVVSECLADRNDWREYYTALALCALRALDWPTVSLSARRLLFVAAAQAISKTQQAAESGNVVDTTQIYGEGTSTFETGAGEE